MHSLRKWFYRPKREDSSKLALFYWADEELSMVATELDSFDGRTDPDRCSILVSQLRICQDKVLSICNDIMDDAIPDMRANRDFRAKFPDDVLHENLAGQLWFGAECLAAGSNIIQRETESASMRPLAKALTRALENVRCLLREQSLKNALTYSDKVKEALRIFDRLFAEFELCYVSAMVPIKSVKEYHLQQEIIVLFSETLIRALKLELVTQEMVDDYDPSLMFTIPRLAIVWGLLLYPDGPFNVERDSSDLSELFRPFCKLLLKIRDLLWTLTDYELHTLEKMLCSLDEPKMEEKSDSIGEIPTKIADDYVYKFYQNHLNCKQFIQDFYAYNFGLSSSENNIPSNNENYKHNKNETNPAKNVEKNHNISNNNIEFGVEFNHTRKNKKPLKSSEAQESDLETLVSSDFGVSDYEEMFNVQNEDDNHRLKYQKSSQSKEFEDTISEEEFRTSESNTNHLDSNYTLFQQSRNESKDRVFENSSNSNYEDDSFLDHTTSSLESRLSKLHDSCTCGINNSSREHTTPSRELIRQVMSNVEIVPSGQHINGYSSSPENSSRAYHHGLLSHSFPTHSDQPRITELNQMDMAIGRRKLRTLYRHRGSQSHLTQSGFESSSRHFYSRKQNISYNAEPYWNVNALYSSPLRIPRVHDLQNNDVATNSETTFSSCSSCQSISSISSPEWDSTSPETSSYNSDCQDDEEIALALQAAEIASRNKARSKFKSSRDLLHKLFVCISGVADQLQTNFASDLRNILKSVFDMNCSQTQIQTCDDEANEENYENREEFNGTNNNSLTFLSNINTNSLNSNLRDDDERDRSSVDSAEEVVPDNSPTPSLVISEVGRESINNNERSIFEGPPEWLPDELSSHCMACKIQFTILRRRHHCRNCGKIFCSRCSSNSIPLPRYGHLKPVRVCNQCFMYELTNLVMQRQL